MLRLFTLLAALTMVCRYTVRDVAFVDLGDENYRLVLKIAEPQPATLGAVAEALLDTNVSYEIDELEDLSSESSKVTLHHPDGRSLDVDIWNDAGIDTVKLNKLTDSPLRRTMLEEVFSHYAYVLFIEGESAEKTARAREVIDGAFIELGKIYDQMPKAVGARPKLTTLSYARREEERTLLFALSADDIGSEPALAILMGRGRRVGPVLVDEEISPTAVFAILNSIGQSCECDLDRSWMQGPRVPLRWDAETKARVVQDLSFDAENPFVRTEISGILARGPQNKQRDAGVSLEEALMAYEEIVIPTPDLPDSPPTATNAEPASSETPDSGQPDFWWLGIAIACAISIGFGTSLAIYSSRRGASK